MELFALYAVSFRAEKDDAPITAKKKQKMTNEDFNNLLNTPPKETWLKKTDDGEASYIPISIIEAELRNDFHGLCQFEIVSERQLGKELAIVARIKVLHPILKKWLSYDGVAGGRIEDGQAYHLFVPSIYARAIQNAVKKIGIKYGANLNREVEESYDFQKAPQNKEEDQLTTIKMLFAENFNYLSVGDQNSAGRIIENKEVNSYKKLLTLLNSIKDEYNREPVASR